MNVTSTSRRVGLAAVCAVLPFAVMPQGRAATALVHAQATVASSLPAAAATRVSTTETEIGKLRQDLAGNYTANVRAVLGMAGGALPSAPALPVPTATEWTRVAALPADLRPGAAGLLAAVDRAVSLMGVLSASDLRTFSTDVQPWLAHLRSHDMALAGQLKPVVWQPTNGAPAQKAPPAVRRAESAAPTAALLLGEALDTYIPALKAHSLEATHVTAAGDGCDMVDEPPVICIASTSDNVISADAALTLAFGGSDTFTGSAGAAPFPAGLATYVPVSLAVSLAGNDVYNPISVPGIAPWDLQLGQGGSYGGGLAMLVDDGGNDRYISTAPASSALVSIDQGSSIGGYGFLIDKGGSNTFSVSAPSGPGSYSLIAQGAGLFCPSYVSTNTLDPFNGCSTGALIAKGSASDSYTINAGTYNDPLHPGGRVAFGQGAGSFADAVLYDGGGNDHFGLNAGAQEIGPTDGMHISSINSAAAEGQAYSAPGYAFLLEGQGNTTYRNTVTGKGMVGTSVWGQGFSAGGTPLGMNIGYSVGALDDEGGTDSFTITDAVSYPLRLTVTDSCGCTSASATVVGTPLPVAWTLGQANGGFDGLALLRHHQGSATYVAQSSASMSVRLVDQLSQPTAPPSLLAYGFGQAVLQAQGFDTGGIGVLEDDSGTDSYTATSDNHVTASATSLHATGVPSVNAEVPYAYSGLAQGVGNNVISDYPNTGALLDRGGTGDRFYARVTQTADAGSTGVAVSPRCFPAFQGAGFGGIFMADGQSPTIVSSPSQGVDPHSSGLRGYGSWENLPEQGSNPDHQQQDTMWLVPSRGSADNNTGTLPRLRFVSAPQSATAGTTVPVKLRLSDASGKPIAGAPLHLDLQAVYQSGLPALTSVDAPIFEEVQDVSATTGSDGTATAQLPVILVRYSAWTAQFTNPFTTASSFRLLATYDGNTGIEPRHAVVPIAIQAVS